jgi:hypothetical protein
MSDALIVAGCLVGYFAISSELLAYFRGRDAVPKWLRLGMPETREGVGTERWIRGAVGVVFVGLALVAMGMIVGTPSEPRGPLVDVVLFLELVIAGLWTLFLVLRAFRPGSAS